MSMAVDWVLWKFRAFVTEMRYDAAIWNKRKATEKLEASCDERFKAIHALEEQVIREGVSVAENLKTLNGAVEAFTKDGLEDHRRVGEQALARINKSKARIERLRASQEQHRQELVGVRQDHNKEGEVLQDLVLDKPRALAELNSSWMELVAYRRASRPPVSHKVEDVTRKYKLQSVARRDAHRFLAEDEHASYKELTGSGDTDDPAVSRVFDELVKQRAAA
jgi:hypothetical protein